MPLHVNNVYANAPQFYLMRKMPIFFKSAPAIVSHLYFSLHISPIQRPLVGLSYNKLQDTQCKYKVHLCAFVKSLLHWKSNK